MMEVIKSPYLQSSVDEDAIISAVALFLDGVRNVEGLEAVQPSPNTTAEEWVKDYPRNVGRGSSHWLGSCKMGDDDGRKKGGSAVVDRDARVWGTENLVSPGPSYLVSVSHRWM